MRTDLTPRPTSSRVPQPPAPRAETTEHDLSDGELPARRSDPAAEHDATLLVAALEQLEAQRAAISWLLDADLLRLLLV